MPAGKFVPDHRVPRYSHLDGRFLQSIRLGSNDGHLVHYPHLLALQLPSLARLCMHFIRESRDVFMYECVH